MQGKPLQYINTMRTAKEAAHMLNSSRKTEVLTGMTVFLGILGWRSAFFRVLFVYEDNVRSLL